MKLRVEPGIRSAQGEGRAGRVLPVLARRRQADVREVLLATGPADRSRDRDRDEAALARRAAAAERGQPRRSPPPAMPTSRPSACRATLVATGLDAPAKRTAGTAAGSPPRRRSTRRCPIRPPTSSPRWPRRRPSSTTASAADPRDGAPGRQARSVGAARRAARRRRQDAQARVLQAVEGHPSRSVLRQAARQLRRAAGDGVRGDEPRVRAPRPNPRQVGRDSRPVDRGDRRRRRRSTRPSCSSAPARSRSRATRSRR